MLLLVALVQGIPRSLSVQTSHYMYQNNGHYVDFYEFIYERKLCATSSNTTREFSSLNLLGVIFFKIVPWCLICILNILIIRKIKQQEEWERSNQQNRQVRIQYKKILLTTSALGTCIQKYIIERYVCLIVFMVIAQTHVQAVATVH